MDFLLNVVPGILMAIGFVFMLYLLYHRKFAFALLLIVCLAGLSVYYYGLWVVRRFEGMGVSLLGVSIFLFGLIVLLIMLLIRMINSNRGESK
ncbi:hypothetical protein GCM10010954_10290 [Halobacillus andaensis]|uniref:Uncharacterized protein n=1 Tax=Halobacillus andaensis TaxID=1176239 RepID=A0A917EU19_HALAA|nr:YesK family protein [Halobacillus andaensis]MBP2003821.1 phosphoglycerol transferase MdoB-like AlkP superfamily enzyme [Halobacillus andaensis]GGF13505.1 hypothetical protein GCM10010954_10290 [Halobacillus andaensis]